MIERLQKYLARAGVASRRRAEELIQSGQIKVNGSIVTELGSKIDPAKDLIVMNGRPIVAETSRRWFLFYKPPGVVSTLSDPQGRTTIADFTKGIDRRIFPVGRLDYDAEGALLLTDDGELANKLMHPKHEVPRTYLAKVKGDPDVASLARLVSGVRLEDGVARAVEATVFEKAERNTWIKLVVTEGRHHLIKRMCAAIGFPVVRLYRPAHATIAVSGQKPGTLRELTRDEVARIQQVASGHKGTEAPPTLPARRHGRAGENLPWNTEKEASSKRPPPKKSIVSISRKSARRPGAAVSRRRG